MIKAQVHVTLKKGILDPQGTTISKSISTLGFDGVSEVRVGKYFELIIKTLPKAELEEKVNAICDKLLANPNIENYRWKIVEENSE